MYHGRPTLLVARTISYDGQLTRSLSGQTKSAEGKTRGRHGAGRGSEEKHRSHMDGSEDAGKRCVSCHGKASLKARKKKWWMRIGLI